MKSKLFNLSLVFLGSMGGIILIESFSFGLRNTFLKNLKDSRHDWKERTNLVKNNNIKSSFPYKTNEKFILSKPLPYKNSKYFEWYVKQLWSKNSKCKSTTYHDGKGFNLRSSDIACRGYEIKNGWRVTTNTPQTYKNSIYIFGGSTVRNAEVPNEFTIASIIQKKINKLGLNYRVKNRGFTTVTTNQQNDFLYKTNIKKNDIIIYYDGGNNQWQGVANNLPKGTIIGTNRKLLPVFFMKKVLSNLQTYKLLSDLKYTNKKHDICEINYENITEKSNAAFDEYKKNLIEANIFVSEKKGKFYHFYQPNLFSNGTENITEYERKLQNSTPSEMVPCGAPFYLTHSSKIFSKRNSELINIGINSKDISHIFSTYSNKRLKDEEYFLDWIHLTERGNYQIANTIFKHISKSF